MNTTVIVLMVVSFLVLISVAVGGYYIMYVKKPTPVDSSTKPAAWREIAGKDYPYNDISSHLQKTKVECTEMCRNSTPCVAALYSPNTKGCWLKSKLGTAEVNTDRILILPPTTVI